MANDKVFTHEFNHGSLQDPSLAAWWSVAADLRGGGRDRILVPLRTGRQPLASDRKPLEAIP